MAPLAVIEEGPTLSERVGGLDACTRAIDASEIAERIDANNAILRARPEGGFIPSHLSMLASYERLDETIHI
jgi:hypothetical protein